MPVSTCISRIDRAATGGGLADGRAHRGRRGAGQRGGTAPRPAPGRGLLRDAAALGTQSEAGQAEAHLDRAGVPAQVAAGTEGDGGADALGVVRRAEHEHGQARVGAQRLGGGAQAGVDGALGADDEDVGRAGGQPGHQGGGVGHHLDPADEGQGDEPGGDVVPDAPALVVHPDVRGAVAGATHPVVDHGLLLALPGARAAGFRPTGEHPADGAVVGAPRPGNPRLCTGRGADPGFSPSRFRYDLFRA